MSAVVALHACPAPRSCCFGIFRLRRELSFPEQRLFDSAGATRGPHMSSTVLSVRTLLSARMPFTAEQHSLIAAAYDRAAFDVSLPATKGHCAFLPGDEPKRVWLWPLGLYRYSLVQCRSFFSNARQQTKPICLFCKGRSRPVGQFLNVGGAGGGRFWASSARGVLV